MERVWINGELIDRDTAAVTPFDHGITTGDGVFETCEVVNRSAFAATRHLRRLRRSATALGLSVPYSDAVLAEALHTIAAEQTERGVVRLTLTGGEAPLSSARAADPRPTVIIAGTGGLGPWSPSERVSVVPWTRNEHGAMAGVKSTSYAENVRALAEARKSGAGEAIFANTAGRLCEGTGTNVFVVLDGELLTPPLSSGCLAGITRELVMELAQVTERDLEIDDLRRADEAFLTSSTRGVHPISHVDGLPLTVPGPVTTEVKTAFDQLRSTSVDP